MPSISVLYLLIKQYLLILGKNAGISRTLGVSHVIPIFLDLLYVRYNCANFHNCRICVTDFRREAFLTPPLPPPIHEQPQTDKDYWRKTVSKLYLVSITKAKDPSIRVKMYHTFYLFLSLFALYLVSGCDLFNMSCLFESLCWLV